MWQRDQHAHHQAMTRHFVHRIIIPLRSTPLHHTQHHVTSTSPLSLHATTPHTSQHHYYTTHSHTSLHHAHQSHITIARLRNITPPPLHRITTPPHHPTIAAPIPQWFLKLDRLPRTASLRNKRRPKRSHTLHGRDINNRCHILRLDNFLGSSFSATH